MTIGTSPKSLNSGVARNPSDAFQIHTGNPGIQADPLLRITEHSRGFPASVTPSRDPPEGRVGKRGSKRGKRGPDQQQPVPPAQGGRISRGVYAGNPRRPTQNRTRHLTFEQLRELVNALTFAEGDRRRRPLSSFLTILWRHSRDFCEAGWVRRERIFWIKVRNWLKRKGVEHRCIWVRECGYYKGPHLHALLDIPRRLRSEFIQFIQRTERLSAGGVRLKSSWTAAAHIGLLRYFMKGADRRDFQYRGDTTVNVSDLLGIEHQGDPLPVNVQRCGVTHNLGPAARRAAGWIDGRSLEDLAGRLSNAVPGKRLSPAIAA